MTYEPNDVPDFVREAEEAMARGEVLFPEIREVTIKFGKGLVGESFTSKQGKELVEVKIPNPDPANARPWESFVISPKMIHENKFGKGVWMKLSEDGIITLSRSVRTGEDKTGKAIWTRSTRKVSNGELKALMEAYKEKNRDSVLPELSEKAPEPGQRKTPVKKEDSR